jgi:hypothetical protein
MQASSGSAANNKRMHLEKRYLPLSEQSLVGCFYNADKGFLYSRIAAKRSSRKPVCSPLHLYALGPGQGVSKLI